MECDEIADTFWKRVSFCAFLVHRLPPLAHDRNVLWDLLFWVSKLHASISANQDHIGVESRDCISRFHALHDMDRSCELDASFVVHGEKPSRDQRLQGLVSRDFEQKKAIRFFRFVSI
jgi:hypothetical protein